MYRKQEEKSDVTKLTMHCIIYCSDPNEQFW